MPERHSTIDSGPDLYRSLLRQRIGPLLRGHGFAGTAGRYHRQNQHGDAVLVGFQRHTTAPTSRMAINMGYLPAAYVDMGRVKDARRSRPEQGFWRFRLREAPHVFRLGGDHWWDLSGDEEITASFDGAAASLAAALPITPTLLDRVQLVALASEERLPFLGSWQLPALVLLVNTPAPTGMTVANAVTELQLRGKHSEQQLLSWFASQPTR